MMPEILKRTPCWTGHYLASEMIHYRLANGKEHAWESFHRTGCNGIAAIVPFTRNKEVVLVRQFRPPVNSYVIEFPAGLNDRNEDLIDVAMRELWEETGYKAGQMTFLVSGPLSAGASSEILSVFLAEELSLSDGSQTDHLEEIEVIHIPKDDFYPRFFQLADKDTLLDLKIPGLFELALHSLTKKDLLF